jgi:hypothetical protein
MEGRDGRWRRRDETGGGRRDRKGDDRRNRR